MIYFPGHRENMFRFVIQTQLLRQLSGKLCAVVETITP